MDGERAAWNAELNALGVGALFESAPNEEFQALLRSFLFASELLLASSIPASLSAQHLSSNATVTAEAKRLFESDWVLMNWALKYYDSDHDLLLEPNELEAAAEKFRQLADTDHDGRVSPEEYRAARALILKTN